MVKSRTEHQLVPTIQKYDKISTTIDILTTAMKY